MFFEEAELPAFQEIERAEEQLRNLVQMTPMEYSPAASALAHNDIYIKWENLQNTGSVKLRGSFYKLQSLKPEEKSRGVVTASWGNHGLGVAYAARFHGIKCTVVLPQTANKALLATLEQHKAKVIFAGTSYQQAYETARELSKQAHSVFVDAALDPKVMAGQGTLGLEVLNQLPGTDAVVVPVCEGGLAFGVALAVKSLNPKVKVYGVEIPGCRELYHGRERSSAGNHPDASNRLQTGRWLDDVFTVTVEEAAHALVFMMHYHKLVSEEAAATALAAAIHQKIPAYTGNVVTLVSGGNVNLLALPKIIQRGLTLF